MGRILMNKNKSSFLSPIFSLCTLFSLGALLVWFLGRMPVFHRAYSDHMQRLEDDAWLEAQCNDPQFISRMRQHADVCQRVRASFQEPAILVGLQACFNMTMTWEMVGITAIFVIVVPTIMLPYYRAHCDRHDRDRMLEACTPTLPPHWRMLTGYHQPDE
jgi:hypothetical protein